MRTYFDRNVISTCWIQQKLHQQETPSGKIEGRGNREEQALFMAQGVETSGYRQHRSKSMCMEKDMLEAIWFCSD